jgi:pimeloyl-ACP methyl ester carboxylesterase/dienelactone hydrolase
MLVLLALSVEAGAGSGSGFVNVPEGTLFYETRGAGPAVVFLHDGLLASNTWDRQISAFASFFRVIRYDRRGYGRSTNQAKEFAALDDLLAVFDALKVTDAVVVGCSAGGGLAIDFALAHPERVRALVLVGPVVGGFDYSEHFMTRVLSNYRPIFQRQDVAATIRNAVEDPWLTDARNPEARAFVRDALTRHPDPAIWRTPRARPPAPALPRLAELRMPTLIVVGATDIPDVHAHVGAIAAGIPGARRVVVERAGHLVHLERPEAFNESVLSFLRPAEEAAAWVTATRDDGVFERGARLFAYDGSAGMDVQTNGIESRGATRVHDLTYASPRGGRVPAYLVVPDAAGPHPGIVFVHHGQGDRRTFLDEALTLAGRGAVSLLIDAPEARPGADRPERRPWDTVLDPAERIQGIVDVRRAFDLLAARPEVDPGRLAYVGYSLGATLGATLAGVESRPKGFVMMAGYPSLTHAHTRGHGQGGVAFRTLLDDAEQKRWVDAMAPLDGVHYAGRSTAAFLLQFATRDEFISRWDEEAYARLVKEPKVEVYPTDHFGLGAASREARIRWLTELLALDGTN